jgi:hypothetical protein
MRIFHYHPVTHEYVGTSEADESPLEPGVFLIPANATDIEPALPGDGQVAVFNESTWITNEDHRGLRCWKADGTPFTIDSLGPFPDDALPNPPPVPPEQRAELLIARRNAALNASDWLVSRHQDEQILGAQTSLSPAQFSTLMTYRKALRDLTEARDWPNVELPAPPDFLI